MANQIILYRGLSSGLPTDLEEGEPAYTTDTKKLYIGDGTTTPVLIGPMPGLPASAISVNADAFSGNLRATDTDVQTALATIDAMTVAAEVEAPLTLTLDDDVEDGVSTILTISHTTSEAGGLDGMGARFAFSLEDSAGNPAESAGAIDAVWFDSASTEEDSQLDFYTKTAGSLTKKMTLGHDGTLTIGAYTLPATDGSEDQVLQTDGSGGVTWVDMTGGDLTPPVSLTIADAATNTIVYPMILEHTTSDTAAKDFGVGLYFKGEPADGTSQNISAVAGAWEVVTADHEMGRLDFLVCYDGAAPAKKASLSATGKLTAEAVTTTLTTDSDGATVTFDMAVSNHHRVVLGGNRTLAVSNVSVGQVFTVDLVQDGTGSRTVTWFTTIKWPANLAPTLTTTLNKTDSFVFKCVSAGNYLGYIVGMNL